MLWSGALGGAETSTALLAKYLRERSVDARVVFVTAPGALCERLDAMDVPWAVLGMQRGSRTLLRPRALARLLSEHGPDGATLPAGGYLAAGLRLGGYSGRLVAVEHGEVSHVADRPAWRRLLYRLSLASGVRAIDAQVAVSGALLARLRSFPHAKNTVLIHHGIDLDSFGPIRPADESVSASDPPVMGFGGRLVPGKGVEDLLAASAFVIRTLPHHLRIAGDGPDRARLEMLASRLGISSSTEFLGWVTDMPAFWRGCELAIVPTNALFEGFGLVALEAMACGRPVVASRNGGLPEVIADGDTGALFDPGNTPQMAAAIHRYLIDPVLRAAHGAAARRRCEELFDIRRTAEAYQRLFEI